jgi:ligand-binding sensor domain-containing protein
MEICYTQGFTGDLLFHGWKMIFRGRRTLFCGKANLLRTGLRLGYATFVSQKFTIMKQDRIMRLAVATALCLTLSLVCVKAGVAAAGLVTTEYANRLLTTQDGLLTNINECIFQDSRGYIWIGSDYGLVCYDGLHFTEYLTNKASPICDIEENERGEIVIYGYYFIRIFNPETREIRLTYSDRNLNYMVFCTPGLPPGYSMYTQRDSGKMAVYRLQNDTLAVFFRHPLFDGMYEGQGVYYDVSGGLFYIPAADAKLSVVDLQGNVRTTFDNVEVCRFIKTENGLLAIGLKGAYIVTPAGIKQVYHYSIPAEAGNVEAAIGKNGALFIHDDHTLYRFCKDRLEVLLEKINTPRLFMFDSEENLWLTTRQGVYNFFKLDVKLYRIDEKNAASITSILPEDSHTTWFGTEAGTLVREKDGQFAAMHYPPRRNGTSFCYRPLQMDGTLFFPTYQDILVWKNGRFSRLDLPPDIYHSTSCRVDSAHFIVGGWNTLWKMDKNGRILGKIEEKSTGRTTMYVAQTDARNNIWIGTRQGVIRLGERDSSYFFNDTIVNSQAITRDASGKVWLSCENRIFHTAGDSLRLFAVFDNIIHNILYTSDNLLVMTDMRKIYIMDAKTGKFKTFDHANGFAVLEPSWNTLVKGFDGAVWFGTQSASVATFDPQTLFERTYTVNLHITDMESSYNNVDWARMNNSAKLDSRRDNVRFSFTGLCFSNPQGVRYRYRLLGFQEEWSERVADGGITFNNLPPGSYTFEIYADAGTDESRSETQSVSFVVRPSFWQTGWFFSLCIMLLILVSAGVTLGIQRRKNRALMEKLRTETELNELRIRSIRLKAIPHFNANVLAAIEYYIANRTKEDAMRILNIYSDFTFKTLSDVDRAARPLSEELAYVQMYLKLEKVRFMEKFDFRISVDEGVDRNVQLPNMMLHTWCENAVKHGLTPLKSGGLLAIRVVQEGQTVCIDVEDNGVGRARAVRNTHVYSSKQGLFILNRQIEIYNRFNRAKIVVQVDDLTDGDRPAGTRFSAKIPTQFTYVNLIEN